jgi:putative membrane protein
LISAIQPHDYLTWALEVFPVLFGLVLVVLTFNNFPLTSMLYFLLWVHSIILIVGGHYTYAEVLLFNWIRDSFDLARNHYDRVGHFMQGFVPAILSREILLRKSVLKKGPWLFFVVICICLAFSACYELFEWATALISHEAADSFLGTQGDSWDTQWDMFLALIGANISLCLLSRWHDKQLHSITK